MFSKRVETITFLNYFHEAMTNLTRSVVSPDVPPHASRFDEQGLGVRQAFEFVSAHCNIKLPIFEILPVSDRNSVERTQTARREQKHKSAVYVKVAAIFSHLLHVNSLASSGNGVLHDELRK